MLINCRPAARASGRLHHSAAAAGYGRTIDFCFRLSIFIFEKIANCSRICTSWSSRRCSAHSMNSRRIDNWLHSSPIYHCRLGSSSLKILGIVSNGIKFLQRNDLAYQSTSNLRTSTGNMILNRPSNISRYLLHHPSINKIFMSRHTVLQYSIAK